MKNMYFYDFYEDLLMRVKHYLTRRKIMYIAPVNSETGSQDIFLGMEQEGKPFLASFSESSYGVVIKISDRLQLNQSFKDSHEKYCRWLPPEVRVRSFIPDHYDMHAEYVEIEVIKGNALYRPGCLFRLTPIKAFRAYENCAAPHVQ